MIKSVKILTLGAILLSSTASYSNEEANIENPKSDKNGEFSGTVTYITDYTFRGVTQTGEEPAIQGSIDYTHNSGFYAGVWASTVDFGANDDASTEADIYAGYNHEVDRFNFNLGGIYYAYPGVDSNLDYDFIEVQGATTYNFDNFSVTGSLNYSPEYFGDTGDAYYLMGKINFNLLKNFEIFDKSFAKALDIIETPVKNYGLLTKAYGFISDNVGLSAHIGRQYVDDNTNFGLPDYNDWSLALQMNIEGFDLALQYVDTNINDTYCPDGCDSKVLFSVSRSF